MNNSADLNPQAKLAKLRQLLQTPGINSNQQARIFKLIQETEAQLNFNTRPNNNYPQPSMMNNGTRMVSGLSPSAKLLYNQPVHPIQHSQQLARTAPMPANMVAFETDEQRLEREFEAEMERRRLEFKRQQERRRQEYLDKLQALESGNVDSLRMFGLSTNYTIDELKSAYKRLAMETHPDRPGGNTEKFQLVTQCYMSLLEKLKGNAPAKSFNDLKAGSMAAASGSSMAAASGSSMDSSHKSKVKTPSKFMNPDGQGFNIKMFNKLYEENKIWDPNDDGYEDWLRKGDVDDISKAPPVFSKSFNISVFNSTFEDYKDQRQKSNGGGGQLQKYDRPQELISTSSGYSVLDGAEKIRDFTKSLDTPGALNYSDLKAAYTGGCDMIDPRQVKGRKEYRNVEELVRDRDKLDYILSPEDQALEEKYAQEAARREEERLARMSARDNLVGQHYVTTHQRMLGRAPDSDNPAVGAIGPGSKNPMAALSYNPGSASVPMLTNRLPASISAGTNRLPPPVSPAAIAALTQQPQAQKNPALTYIGQADQLAARRLNR